MRKVINNRLREFRSPYTMQKYQTNNTQLTGEQYATTSYKLKQRLHLFRSENFRGPVIAYKRLIFFRCIVRSVAHRI